jgi:hypothetical protein
MGATWGQQRPNIRVVINCGVLQTYPQRAISREPVGLRRGSILVLVNDGMYADLKDSLATYTNDLSREGYKTTVRSVNVNLGPLGDVFFRSYKDLKSLIRDWYTGLAQEMLDGKLGPLEWIGNSGVVLVGDLPIAYVHQRGGEWVDEKTGAKGPYEGTSLCEMFLTDLNGDWNATDGAFIPFLSTVDTYPPPDSECRPNEQDDPKWLYPPSAKMGKSGAEPEIFLGRICAKRVSGGDRNYEVQLVKEYFARNHDYRMGKWLNNVSIPLTSQSYVAWPRLAWYDDGWRDWGPIIAASMSKVWPGLTVANNDGPDAVCNRYVNDLSLTTKADYLQRLTSTQWLWVDFLAHSNPWGHYIEAPGDDNVVHDWDLASLNLKSLFYLLQGCDTSDFSKTNNLGETYLFRGNSLVVMGNTTVGPCDSGQLYECLSWGTTIGQAFMMQQWLYGQPEWKPNIASAGAVDPKRYYAWVILGDPTLPVIPPAAPQYADVCTASAPQRLALLQVRTRRQDPVVFAKSTGLSVRTRLNSDDWEKPRVVRNLKPGIALDISRDLPVVDPKWRTYMSRSVVQPRFEPKFQPFRLLSAPGRGNRLAPR